MLTDQIKKVKVVLFKKESPCAKILIALHVNQNINIVDHLSLGFH